jgi:lipopolysaccharide/colanic/teichoic acid biosynthesis glycosyltransferase
MEDLRPSAALWLKHAVDRVVALGSLVFLSPVLGAIAAWVYTESGSPVLLWQERAGRGGKPFRMLKFRTMVPDAIEAGRALGLADPFGVLPNDPRITRSGAFLRRTGLDELPQLWNVLRGEMSLVGPRPDLVEQAAHYTDEDSIRLAVRPGITGWAQIRGRDEIPWPVRFRQDAWYVRNWSLGLDARIMAKTLLQLGRGEPRPVEDHMNIRRLTGRANAIVEVPDEDWDATLAELGHADAYSLRGYVDAASAVSPGRPRLLRVGDTTFACIVSPIPGSDREDVSSPYGYGGPFGTDERFWPAYEDWCAQSGVVSSFVRFHPLAENHLRAPEGMTLERLADTVSWPLQRGGGLFESMHRHHRRVVKKARSLLDTAVIEAPGTLESFAALYDETMRRHDAGDSYLFPSEYWDRLGVGLKDRLVLFEARDADGVCAAILCLASTPWLHYHLGGSLERARSSGANHLLLLTAAEWARERGFSQFHLGGGVGGREDSLWEFKHRFAPGNPRELWIGKLVHDEQAYAELSQTSEVDGWFPAYRRARGARGLPIS